MSSLAGDIPVVVCRSILEKEVLQRLLPLGPFEVSNSYCFQDGLAAALHYFGASMEYLSCMCSIPRYSRKTSNSLEAKGGPLSL